MFHVVRERYPLDDPVVLVRQTKHPKQTMGRIVCAKCR